MPTATASATTTFTPLHDRLLVRRIEDNETVRGGIIIPDSAKEKPQEGEVIFRRQGQIQRRGQSLPARCEEGRPHPLRQILRHRDSH